MLLNYGHTLAHALEAAAFDPDAGWDLRHGEAVAVGLVFAGQLARRLGRIDDRREELHRRVVGGFDLSPLLPHDADPERLVSFMARDKKAHHDLTFVLDGPRWRRGGAWRGPGRRDRYPGSHGSDRAGRPSMTGDRADRPAVGTQPRPAGRAGARGLRHRHPGRPRGRRRPPWPTGLGYAVEHHQTNHEGELVEAVHAARGRADAIIINAGALSHTSWSLHDALAAFAGVVVELHLSNPAAREPFRHTSVIAPVADGCIAGFGGIGYGLAVDAVHRLLTAPWPDEPRLREPGPGAARGGRPPGPPAVAARRAGGRRRAGRRAAGHHAGQHPVADRVQRLGRPAAGDGGPGPAHHRRSLPDPVDRATGRGRRGRGGGGGRRRGPDPAGGRRTGGPRGWPASASRPTT